MRKIIRLSAIAACILAVSGGALADQSTVTGGYAQGDMQGVVNKAKGFNLKYRYEFDDNPWGVISSFSYIAKSGIGNEPGFYDKAQYYGLTAGPAYRINDWASIYGLIGVGLGAFKFNADDGSSHNSSSDAGFAYGGGLQFNPWENVAFDVGYEQNRIRSVDIGTWNVGVGYRF